MCRNSKQLIICGHFKQAIFVSLLGIVVQVMSALIKITTDFSIYLPATESIAHGETD